MLHLIMVLVNIVCMAINLAIIESGRHSGITYAALVLNVVAIIFACSSYAFMQG